MPSIEDLSFPHQLDKIRDRILAQEPTLKTVAELCAAAIAAGGVAHIYANGHSRVTVEELCVRMGAITGFHPILAVTLNSFTDVVGASGLRLAQAIEKVEGLGAKLLDEFQIASEEPLIVVSATGQTAAAVDIALEFTRRYPDNPIVAIASEQQAREGAPKHSSGKTLYHVIQSAARGYFLDNGMPMGDVSTTIQGRTGTYSLCPLSSIGALTIVQSLNELTARALDNRGVKPIVLANMHLGQTEDNYNMWLSDQRRRYAQALWNPSHSEADR